MDNLSPKVVPGENKLRAKFIIVGCVFSGRVSQRRSGVVRQTFGASACVHCVLCTGQPGSPLNWEVAAPNPAWARALQSQVCSAARDELSSSVSDAGVKSQQCSRGHSRLGFGAWC